MSASCYSWHQGGRGNHALINSPAIEALRYEKKVFHSPVDGNPFAGPPRQELDDAWHKLLKNIHIRVSKQELDDMGGQSLELSDGTGYLSSLEVYHDLHCLKRIRHFMYRDHYLPNMTEKELAFQTFHTEHCLEHFRELVMCRGDIALTTFYYRYHEQTASLLAEH
ncbi:hypothetical protein HYALB_00009692 [Hymenoscyphus albidus]|uniref:Uncharacterized protein n=1 Tax=Hymenoscyphus albidus TaxID=595503 RepID=A0A9N9LGY4_9HELO|nr:hypothetical protein HYALB_00009692 [Hymenoscyphus albidus]